MKRYDLVIWDFDGTVVDTSPGIYQSVSHALEKMGMEDPGSEKLSQFVGPPLAFSAREYLHLPEETIDGFVKTFRLHYQAEGLFNAKVFDGISKVLAFVQEQGGKNAIATLKPLFMAKQLLEHFSLEEHFDYVYGGSSDERGGITKADMLRKAMDFLQVQDRRRAVMVGDTRFDYDGAKEMGVDFVGAAWGGTFTPEDAQKGRFAFLAQTPLDLLDFLGQ